MTDPFYPAGSALMFTGIMQQQLRKGHAEAARVAAGLGYKLDPRLAAHDGGDSLRYGDPAGGIGSVLTINTTLPDPLDFPKVG